MEKLFEIKENNSFEIVINKSRFIAYSFIVRSAEDIENNLKILGEMHQTANHICYGYKYSSFEKYSDDGEPQGTAGKPILEIIKKNNIQNILIAVVRYFGGIKLGAGGLIRAYSKSANGVLENSQVIEKTCCKKVCFSANLNESKNQHMVEKINGVKNVKIEFCEQINFTIYADAEHIENVKQNVENVFARKINFDVAEENYYF